MALAKSRYALPFPFPFFCYRFAIENIVLKNDLIRYWSLFSATYWRNIPTQSQSYAFIYNWICLFFLYSLQVSSFFFFFRFAMTFLWRRSDWMGYCIVRTTLPSRSHILFLSYILTPFRSCNMMVSWCIYLIAMIIRKNALLIYNTLIRYCCGHWSSHFFLWWLVILQANQLKYVNT